MTRKEAISWLEELTWREGEDVPIYDTDVEAIKMAITALKQENRWIPVDERLPEESTAVLVWCPERKNIYCAYREVNQWWIFGAYFEKVTFKVKAWMPLPEPYEGGNKGANEQKSIT